MKEAPGSRKKNGPHAGKKPVKGKRALTQQRSKSPVSSRGESQWAQRLSSAISQASTTDSQLRDFSHGFHSYAAKLHPLTLRSVLAAEAEFGRLLDPFCGSGTVLVEGLARGMEVVGNDLNPLALMISRAKTRITDEAYRKRFAEAAECICARSIEITKAARSKSGQTEKLPSSAERNRILRRVFLPHVRRELETIRGLIVQESDEDLRNDLHVALSSLLSKSANNQSANREAGPPKAIGRLFVTRWFGARCQEYLSGWESMAGLQGKLGGLWEDDVLKLGDKELGPFDWVMSSPPYAGTYDYWKEHLIRLAFLGLDTTTFRDKEVGARRDFADTELSIAEQSQNWRKAMVQVMESLKAVLAPQGKVLWVVGDSMLGPRGQGDEPTAMYADLEWEKIAKQAGFELLAMASQGRRPLGKDEKQAFSKRRKREHLMLFVKGTKGEQK